MNIDLRKAGKALLATNFVLVAGIVAAGTDLLSPAAPPVRNESVFREVGPRTATQAAHAPENADYSDVTSGRFRPVVSGGAAAARPGAAAAIENSYRVTGTMISNNDRLSCAVVEDVRTKAQNTVFVGDVIGPVEIVAIRQEEIEVRMQGQLMVLKLYASAPSRGAKQRVASPAADRRNRQDRPEPPGSKPAQQQSPSAGQAPTPGSGGSSGAAPAVESALQGVSPEILAYWEKLPAEERKRWEQWWSGKSPEERGKWQERLTQMARQKAGK